MATGVPSISCQPQDKQQPWLEEQRVAVRRYCPTADHAAVTDICRNVYGGTDDLPHTINARAAEPGTHILAAAAVGGGSSSSSSSSRGGIDSSSSSTGPAQLDALLCCQQRGDVVWLWGARTREERRCSGLAQLLLEEAEAVARGLPDVSALLSITVTANSAMRHLFTKAGFRQQGRIVTWPASEVALAAHQQLQELLLAPEQQQLGQQQEHQGQGQGPQPHGEGNSLQQGDVDTRLANEEQQGEADTPQLAASTDGMPPMQQSLQQHGAQQQQQQPPSLLTVLPAVAAVVDSPAARQLLPSWRRCRYTEELTALLLLLRQQRTDGLQQQQHNAIAAAAAAGVQEPAAGGAAVAGFPPLLLGAASNAFLWLPGQYELEPAESAGVRQLIREGRVWLLEPGGGTQQQQGQQQGQQGQQQAGHGGSSRKQQQQHDQVQHQQQAPEEPLLPAGAAAAAAAAGVLVLYGPGFRGMHYAGVVAGSPAALEAAVLQAAAADPACCRFYTDCCGRFEHARLWGSTGGERFDILPFYKPLLASPQ